MKRSPLEWLMWSWRVACASYVVGVLTMLPFASLIVWWTLLLFGPLVAVTWRMTRSRRVATLGGGALACAGVAAALLWYGVSSGSGVPKSPVYLVLWVTGVIGPIVLYPIVVREIGRVIGSSPGQAIKPD
jgi:apolipoprotein N-acyltransferase